MDSTLYVNKGTELNEFSVFAKVRGCIDLPTVKNPSIKEPYVEFYSFQRYGALREPIKRLSLRNFVTYYDVATESEEELFNAHARAEYCS